MSTPKHNKIPDLMIDTVAIRITYPNFSVAEPKLFTPALIIKNDQGNFDSQYGRHRFTKYQQNATSQDKRAGIYLPRLTVYQRYDGMKPTYQLYIEFSVPKLIFNNNIQEVGNSDFESIVKVLQIRLKLMGIGLFEHSLRKAIVVKAHFGKNIQLPHPITAQDAISTLYKADMGKRKDINIRHYGNDGQALYFYASSANIIFYDKIKDMENTKARAMDKDKLKNDKPLAKELQDDKCEILRFEVRLTKQQSLNAFLTKVIKEKIKGITFEKMFNQELCQKVLLTSWQEIINSPASQLALKLDRPLQDIFDLMIKNISPANKKKAHSLSKTLAVLGLYVLINQYGVRNTRNKIEKNWTNKSWKRLSPTIKSSATTLGVLPVSHTISDIQLALEKFEKYDWKPQ